MGYLLDTCIISKLRQKPSDNLQKWILSHPETEYHISVLTIGEIQFGISKLDDKSKKKSMLEEWLLVDLIPRFKNRIFQIDVHTVSIWGSMRATQQKKGRIFPVIDSLIASTAIQHNLILATENTRDFEDTGVYLINPC
jgi:predicted nucleic acid-binding protein